MDTILSDILFPYSPEQFMKLFLAKRPLIIKGEGQKARLDLVGPNPKEELLNEFKKYAATLTCHSHSPQVPPPTARAVNSADEFHALVQEYHQSGYTVRVPEITKLSPKLDLLTRILEKIFDNPVGVVAFWSAPGAAAPIHYDEVDVIVIQLSGIKRWHISDQPSRLPNKWKLAGEGVPQFNSYQTLDVEPGDFIYLPRGTAHTVQSMSESIHLSIGFVPFTVGEGLNALLEHFSDEELALRQSLFPFGAPGDLKSTAIQLRDALDKFVARCDSQEFIEAALAHKRARMIAKLPKLEPSVHVNVGQNSLLKRNPLALEELITTDKFIDLSQPGERIIINRSVEEAIHFITKAPEFYVSELPGELSPEVRISLVSKLLSTGYLVPA